MKKLILPIGFIIFFLLLISSNPLFAQAEDKNQTAFDEASCYKTCQTAFDECGKSCKTKEYFSEGIDEECLSPCREPRRICNLRCYETAIASKKAVTPSEPTTSPQAKEASCNKIQKILKSKDCPNWAIDPEALQVYCSQNPDELVYVDSEGRSVLAFRKRASDYAIDQACFDELKEKGFVSGSSEDQTSSSQKTNQPAKSAKEISDWIKDVFGDTPFSDIAIEPSPIVPVRPPEITDQKLEDLKLPPITIPSLWNLLPESGYKPEPVPSGSTISSDDEPILVSPGKGGEIMHVAPDTKVTLPSDPAKSNPTIHQGTVEFKTDKPMEVNTDIVDIIVIGTHFWVTHEPGKQTLVGVYTGQVEVKTKDGKTQIVSPDGDKPGVVVVSQRLSPVKLASVGAVVVLLIIGVVWFFKRKSLPKIGNTGRKKR